MQKNGSTFGQQLTPTQAQHSLSSSSLSPTHQFSTCSSTSSIQTESSGYASLADSFSAAQLVTGINESSSHDTGAQESYLQDTGSTQLQAGCQLNGPIVCTRMPSVDKRLQEIKEDLREDLKEDLEKHLKELCTQILHEKIESMKLDSSSASSVSEYSATEQKPHPTPLSSSKNHDARNHDALTSSGFSSPSGSSSSLLLESRGSQTPEGLKRSSCSDSECMKRVMLKRKPKLSNVQKANSASDAVSSV